MSPRFSGRQKIMLQKKAVYDAKAYGWLMWNARNVYTVGALEPGEAKVVAGG